jgi:hypothetical protein
VKVKLNGNNPAAFVKYKNINKVKIKAKKRSACILLICLLKRPKINSWTQVTKIIHPLTTVLGRIITNKMALMQNNIINIRIIVEVNNLIHTHHVKGTKVIQWKSGLNCSKGEYILLYLIFFNI